ncbi:unnamed protein product [Amoebophrya sp. A25]|nr:unnamed protein product [Amoebophrya sp. A25]|eukprot:GSA25T00022965001.1
MMSSLPRCLLPLAAAAFLMQLNITPVESISSQRLFDNMRTVFLQQDPAAGAGAAVPETPPVNHEVDAEEYNKEWHKEFRDEAYPSSAANKDHHPMMNGEDADAKLPWGWGSGWFWLSGMGIGSLVGLAFFPTSPFVGV